MMRLRPLPQRITNVKLWLPSRRRKWRDQAGRVVTTIGMSGVAFIVRGSTMRTTYRLPPPRSPAFQLYSRRGNIARMLIILAEPKPSTSPPSTFINSIGRRNSKLLSEMRADLSYVGWALLDSRVPLMFRRCTLWAYHPLHCRLVVRFLPRHSLY